jgi:hypothetical protein
MPSIPLWLTAVNGPFAVVLTPQTVNASTGALTDGTPSTLTSVIAEAGVEIDHSPELRDIRGATSLRANNVIVGVSTRITLNLLLKSAGTNDVATAIQSSDYYKCVITRGAQAWTFYGVRAGYTESISRDAGTATLTLEMIDPGQANPSYA